MFDWKIGTNLFFEKEDAERFSSLITGNTLVFSATVVSSPGSVIKEKYF